MLSIKNLTVTVADKKVLSSLSLTIPTGESHALMGKNGSGKSTLAALVAGHPDYTVESGTITINDTSLLDLSPEQRAQMGVFVAFQSPPSIPGVTISQFLRLSVNSVLSARGEAELTFAEFKKELQAALKAVDLPWSFASRYVNDGFSGGERKRLEIAQLLLLKPTLAILDEIDSGLDIDALKQVRSHIESWKKLNKNNTLLIISHYNRILESLTLDAVHIMANGSIQESGTKDLAIKIESDGYQS